MNSRIGLKCRCKICNRANYIQPGVGRVYVDPINQITLATRYLELHREHIGDVPMSADQAKQVAKVIQNIYRNLGFTKKNDEITTCTPIRMLIHWQYVNKKSLNEIIQASINEWTASFDWHLGYNDIRQYKPVTILDQMCQDIKSYKSQQETDEEKSFLQAIGLASDEPKIKEKIEWRM